MMREVPRLGGLCGEGAPSRFRSLYHPDLFQYCQSNWHLAQSVLVVISVYDYAVNEKGIASLDVLKSP